MSTRAGAADATGPRGRSSRRLCRDAALSEGRVPSAAFGTADRPGLRRADARLSSFPEPRSARRRGESGTIHRRCPREVSDEIFVPTG